jgi:hypothetical protein
MGILATALTCDKRDITTEQRKLATFMMAAKSVSITPLCFGVQRKLSQLTCTALTGIMSVLK